MVDLSGDISGAVNVTLSWTLSGGDSADFYLISITTNAPQTPYGGLLNITASVTQYELTGFMAGYEYNITVRGVTSNCGGLVGRENEPLTIIPQGKLILYLAIHLMFNDSYLIRYASGTFRNFLCRLYSCCFSGFMLFVETELVYPYS